MDNGSAATQYDAIQATVHTGYAHVVHIRAVYVPQ